MKTKIQCPTVEELEQLDHTTLKGYAQLAELAISKPYFLDRIKVAIHLKETTDK